MGRFLIIIIAVLLIAGTAQAYQFAAYDHGYFIGYGDLSLIAGQQWVLCFGGGCASGTWQFNPAPAWTQSTIELYVNGAHIGALYPYLNYAIIPPYFLVF